MRLLERFTVAGPRMIGSRVGEESLTSPGWMERVKGLFSARFVGASGVTLSSVIAFAKVSRLRGKGIVYWSGNGRA